MIKTIPLLLATAAALFAASPDTEKKQVLNAMEELRQAMIHRDGPALDRLLSDDLTYSHSTGQLETKAEMMKAITSGSSIIEKLEYSNTTVRVYGNMALVKGRVDLWHSATNQVPMDVLHVWANNAGRWRLVARQATRLAK